MKTDLTFHIESTLQSSCQSSTYGQWSPPQPDGNGGTHSSNGRSGNYQRSDPASQFHAESVFRLAGFFRADGRLRERGLRSGTIQQPA